MDRRKQDKQFRREIARRIADIQDNFCGPCHFKDCTNCEHDKKLKHYGNLLLQKSQGRDVPLEPLKKEKGESPVKSIPEANEETIVIKGLAKEKYKMLKDEGKKDAEIMEAYNLSFKELTTAKNKWGVVGYRGKVDKIKQKAQSETPASSAEELKEQLKSVKGDLNELTQKHKGLKELYENLLNENSQAAAEFLKIKRELEQTKTAFDELVLQKRDLQNDLSVAERNLDFLREKVEEKANDTSYKQKYLVMAAALKLHLPDGLEVKS